MCGGDHVSCFMGELDEEVPDLLKLFDIHF
jgi:hypothetical protein